MVHIYTGLKSNHTHTHTYTHTQNNFGSKSVKGFCVRFNISGKFFKGAVLKE